MVGRFVISKAGHDKDRIYVVVSCKEDSYDLADGRLKTVERPKRKKKKHVQLTNSSVEPELAEALKKGMPHLDDRIRYAVKCYEKLITNRTQEQ